MEVSPLAADLLGEIEVHSPEGIRRVFRQGLDPVAPIKGKRPVDCLIEAYLRSDRLADCLREMLAAGATTGDPLLEAILLDDPVPFANHAGAPARRFDLLTAFTSCRDVTALHVAAEFGSLRCARALLDAGADVDARAGMLDSMIGGHTPVFHTVNSIHDYCRPVMELLVHRGAALDLRVNALLWGESFEWETVVFDVTPLSYAQCGLFRQFHRNELQIQSNLEFLYEARFGTRPRRRNVPNAYLRS